MKKRNHNKMCAVDRKLFPELINGIIEELKLEDLEVECIVAPNEADGQLCRLEKIGKIKAVISEDSDMIAYGCKKILFNFNLENRKASEFKRDAFKSKWEFSEFSDQEILQLCILTWGCDYVDPTYVNFLTLRDLMKKHKD